MWPLPRAAFNLQWPVGVYSKAGSPSNRSCLVLLTPHGTANIGTPTEYKQMPIHEGEGKASPETSSSLRSHSESFPGTQDRKWVCTTVNLLFRVLPRGNAGCLVLPTTATHGGQGIVPGLASAPALTYHCGDGFHSRPLPQRSRFNRGLAYPSSTALRKRLVCPLSDASAGGWR